MPSTTRFWIVLSLALAVSVITTPVRAQDTSTDPIQTHGLSSKTKLGLNYIFNPKAASQVEVFRIYNPADINDIVWGTSDSPLTLDIVLSAADATSGMILRQPNITMLFSTFQEFEQFERRAQDQGISVLFASRDKLKGVKIEPDHLVVHWPGSTPESVGVGTETVALAQKLSESWYNTR